MTLRKGGTPVPPSCLLGGEPLTATDALPLGTGHACAAHVMRLTARLKREGIVIVPQRQRKEARRG